MSRPDRNDHSLNNLQAYSSISQERGIRLIFALIAISTLSSGSARADDEAGQAPIMVAENATLPGAIEI